MRGKAAYQRLERIGSGHHADAYKARRKMDGLTVVIKVPKAHGGHPRATPAADLQQEVSLLSRLKHEHIVRMLDSYVDGGVPVMVAE
eukprot:gene23844-21703_t